MKVRPEAFGAVVCLEWPRAIVSVNRPMARLLGVEDSPSWHGPPRETLSAPTEVHLVVSRQCSAGCKSCYVDATPQGAALSLTQAKAALDRLAASGVFHVALGGGEALDLDYLFEIAQHARALGILPNLTTAGLTMSPETARRCRVFGQINVSVDGVGAGYRDARGFDGFARAERALRLLREVKREVGINCVVSRSSFEHLGAVAALAKRLKLNELELLRFKPAGRGIANFAEEDLTEAQAKEIFPLARRLLLRHRVRIKLDCSFAPMVFWHRPSARVARFFGVVGCEGGNLLASVMPDGALTGCSFGGPTEASIFDEAGTRRAFDQGFTAFRDYVSQAAEPCRSCDYLTLCKGGCRVVAKEKGDWWQPDPGCPKVVEHRRTTADRPPVSNSKTPSVALGARLGR
jgi:radical SAM protein with 4Fe4S-binding SPASM domain